MPLNLDLRLPGNSMPLADAQLPGADRDTRTLDTPVSPNPQSILAQIRDDSILSLPESCFTGFEPLAK